MGKKKQEPKFYVMDPTADETAQAYLPLNDHMSAFDGFQTLKQAVRYILAAENTDEPWTTPKREILDENGDAIEVDWDADEYKTREQLTQERDRAKSSTIMAADGRLRAEKALLEHQKHLIDAGLIPIDLLNDFIVDIRVTRSPAYDPEYRVPGNVRMVPMHRIDVDVKFLMAAPDTAAAYALNKLIDHKR